MQTLRYIPITTEEVTAYRQGKLDYNQQIPEPADGTGSPCRHCLNDIANDETSLLLGYRPFPRPDPYAESGPIFIHATNCEYYAHRSVPAIIKDREQIIIRGYDKNNRIIEGTGKVINTESVESEAHKLFTDDRVDYLHIRSVTNNCYFCRVERG